MSPLLQVSAPVASGSIFAEGPDPACRAIVVIPARNEERTLPSALDALRLQRGLDGRALPAASYEVLVLLNNCTDASATVVRRYADCYPEFALHHAQVSFAPEDAHVGTARRLLMDAACERLEDLAALRGAAQDVTAILSTDADTRVAPDWVARNLLAIERGAEVVGGVIHLDPKELGALDLETRLAYERDRRLQELKAELEALLDPDPHDPWPRHLEHFGASIACTPEVYRRCGGLPAVRPLEDVAFVDALRRVGARIRHAPDVHIETSARMNGRVEIGLSGQLRHWHRDGEAGRPQIVDSAEWLAHRFASMHWLRRVNERASIRPRPLVGVPQRWRQSMATLCRESLPTPSFLERLDCEALIEETFSGERYADIVEVLAELEVRITKLRTAAQPAPRPAPARPA